jgi:hypothetical protein
MIPVSWKDKGLRIVPMFSADHSYWFWYHRPYTPYLDLGVTICLDRFPVAERISLELLIR